MKDTVKPLSSQLLNEVDAYWRAANYLSVGQIYLFDNPLLKKPLAREHIKPRLLGHWGTTPGLNFIYVHLNRVIKQHDLEHDLRHRARPRRARLGGQRLSRRHVQRGVSEHLTGRSGDAAAVQAVLVSRAAFRATWRPKHPAPFTKAASWATRFRMPMARRSTIRT